jgi:hypothetical protein
MNLTNRIAANLSVTSNNSMKVKRVIILEIKAMNNMEIIQKMRNFNIIKKINIMKNGDIMKNGQIIH